ncbi:MAG: DUF2304 domain-containing protein [Lachnospiraceae bacterium]|nr:DUF2304 domain-containing protein [Lachnospiraceae bacterium]
MSLRLQIIIIVIMVLLLMHIINMVSKKKMDFKFGLIWAMVDIVIMILAIWPKLLAMISNLLGIASPVNMIFFFGMILSMLIIFSLSMEISYLSDRVKKLSQELAILRKDTYDGLNKKKDND